MKIGFYGHSSVCWAGYPIDGVSSFIDLILEKYEAKLVNYGVPQGSEERILFELKKTKDIDLAIIFHSTAGYLFLPKCSRDILVNDAGIRKALQLWNPQSNQEYVDATTQKYFTYGKIKEVFGDIETFVSTMALHHKYLYHPDLQMNRFIGSLIQIDQYLAAKKIPTIHVYWDKILPSWFSFTHGILAPEIADLTNEYAASGYPNNISPEGQIIIADKLSLYIEALNTEINKTQ